MNCTFAANLLPLLKLILRNRVLKDDFQYSPYPILQPCTQPCTRTRNSHFEIGTYLSIFLLLLFLFFFFLFFLIDDADVDVYV